MNEQIAWLLAEQRVQELRAEAARCALIRRCTPQRRVGGWWRRGRARGAGARPATIVPGSTAA